MSVVHHLGETVSLILDNLEVKSTDDAEGEADAFARDALIPPEIWEEDTDDSASFSSEELMSVATKAGVHPAIKEGRLRRDNNNYRHFAKRMVSTAGFKEELRSR